MRLSKMFIVLLVGGSVLYAQNSIKEAKLNMSDGINKIQKGLIDNNRSIIQEGVLTIRKGNQAFWDKQNLKNYLSPQRQKHINKVLLISHDLDRSLLELETSLEDKSNTKAQEDYLNILNNCAKCHKLLNKSL